MGGSKIRQESNEWPRADREHDTKGGVSFFKRQEGAALGSYRRAALEESLKVRPDDAAETGDVRAAAFTSEQLPPEFMLQTLDRPSQRWLSDPALPRRLGEIERLTDCYKILGLMHLHGPTQTREFPRIRVAKLRLSLRAMEPNGAHSQVRWSAVTSAGTMGMGAGDRNMRFAALLA